MSMERIHIDNDILTLLQESKAFGLTLDQLAKAGIRFYAELGSTKKHCAFYDMRTGDSVVFSRPEVHTEKRDKTAR
jgi:hypothetical protein